MRQLGDAGYHVSYRKVNARCQGVPQNRMRTYIAGVHRDVPEAATFSLPEDIDMMPLEALLEGDGPESVSPDDVELMGLAHTSRRNVVEAIGRLEDGPPRDWILDDRQSAGWSSRKAVPPRRWSPCLVHGRDAGYWIGSRHRRLTVAEGCRLQGVRPELVRLPGRKITVLCLANAATHNSDQIRALSTAVWFVARAAPIIPIFSLSLDGATNMPMKEMQFFLPLGITEKTMQHPVCQCHHQDTRQ